MEQNLRFLRDETGVHVHADLIVGLPGEGVDSFAAGFDRLVALGPQEIQVGMLKRLRGTPIVRHDAEFGMAYSPHAPYEVLQTRDIDFATMQRLRRFSPLLGPGGQQRQLRRDGAAALGGAARRSGGSSNWPTGCMSDGKESRDRVAPPGGFPVLPPVEQRARRHRVAASMWRDYQRGGRGDCPEFLRDYVPEGPSAPCDAERLEDAVPPRQARHLSDSPQAR